MHAGLNYQQLIQRTHKAQVGRAHVYINALNTGDAFLEETVLEEHNTFQPNLSDKHHYIPPKNDKRKYTNNTQVLPCSNPSTFGVNANTHGNTPQPNPTPQKSITGDFFQVPQELEDALLKTCIPTVVKYQTSYQRCETCKYKWDVNYMEMPHNIIFRMKMFCEWHINRFGPIQHNHFLSNACFCLHHMDCLTKIVPGMQKKHLYMDNCNMCKMTDDHVQLLKNYGYWENIITNRKKLLEQGLEAFNFKN